VALPLTFMIFKFQFSGITVVMPTVSVQCSDNVGWAPGRAYGL